MPRYLVLTELFLPTKGGTAVWFAEVYRRLSGKETHIVTADVPGAAEVDASHPNSVHRINMRRVAWLRPESLGMYVNLFAKSLWLALTHRFDAIHAGRALPEGLSAWAVARLTFHPVVIYAHGEELTTWGRGGKYKAMRFALRHADRVIANSEFTRNELIKMDVNPTRIALIYPGVDVARFRPGLACADLRQSVNVTSDGKLILSVGRLSRRKGFDRIIQALPALIHTGLNVQYAVIGIGEDQEYLLNLARAHGVAERVHLLGHVSADDLPRWYNACDIFAMPNREIHGDTEGFGMVFLEAAACGKPSLAGIAGGTGAAVLDEETGLRLDGTDGQKIHAALVRLLGDTILAAQLGKNGLTRAVKEFSWDSVAAKTLALNATHS
ncbi:glycosyltransferase family 4 protein [Sulfuricella sp.]|uniref:glycosyltransferase family 4 protein n=1 Tax=Sulfuricella sp. TaxID=2099377 RepID=UPI002C6649FE|nr:glycosyltransferase family 4 protein [Sulfuricella sp.]HUX65315.1 glycosyltransferase family 4 protein [Sulfuricella sp.]